MMNWTFFLLAFVCMNAQMDISTFLRDVAMTNPTIKAEYLKYKQQASTYYINVLPERPELSLERNEILKGASLNSANEKNLSITQQFKFPVVYYYRHKTATLFIEIAYQNYLLNSLGTLLAAQKEASYYLIILEKKFLIDEFVLRYSVLMKQISRSKLAGEVSEMDVLRISLEYEQLLNDQKRIAAEIIAQKAILQSYLPSFSDTLVKSDFSTTDLSKDKIHQDLSENSPAIQVAKLELKQSEYQVSEQYYNRLPDFSFTFRKQDIDNISYKGFEFGLSLPLWIPKEIEEIEISSYQKDISNLRLNANQIFLKSFFDNKWETYQSALSNWNRYLTSLLPKSAQVFSIAQKQYEAGEISYFEFIDNYRVWKNIRLSELDQRLFLISVKAELQQTNLIKYLEKEEN